MLSLEPFSTCDVCTDEFGPRNQPHCITCGHIFCLKCCNTIIEKATRAPPACPLCRETFTRESIRQIRIDCGGSPSTSGWSTPRRSPRSPRAPLIEDDFPNDLLLKASMPTLPSEVESKFRAEARRLENKIAHLAVKKCSVDEVQALSKEVEAWLSSDVGSDSSSTLYLSSLLLRTIIQNHIAFSDTTKAAKARIEELERDKARLEIELQRKSQHPQKASDGHSVRSELGHFRTKSAIPTSSPTRPHVPSSTTSVASHQTVSPPISRATSHSPPQSRVASPTSIASHQFLPSALSRLTSLSSSHGLGRSASVAPPHRTTTPGAPLRSATPAAPSSSSSSPARAPLTRKTRTLSMSGPSPSAIWHPPPAAAQPSSRPLGPRHAVPTSSSIRG